MIVWPLADAWTAATEAVAGAYGVPLQTLRSESRGRGPRPPAHIWEAKKMAVHLAVILSDAPYAELARHIGYHKDTVSSHCAAMRLACADDEEVRARSEALQTFARQRLRTRDRLAASGIAPPAAGAEDGTVFGLMLQMQGQLQAVLAAVASSSDTRRMSGASSDSAQSSRNRDREAGTKDEAA